MYQLTDVTRLFTKGRHTIPAVRDLSLVIDDGEWLAIQGRTGHGKSTLLNLLGTLDRPTSGSIDFHGKNRTRLSEAQLTRVRAESIGFIFQTFNLVPTLSAAENVEAALIPLGVGAAQRHRRVDAVLDSVGPRLRARQPRPASRRDEQGPALDQYYWRCSEVPPAPGGVAG